MECIQCWNRILSSHLPLSCTVFSLVLDSDSLQNMNWIRKRLDDSRNKLGSLYQGSASSTEVYEVGTVSSSCCSVDLMQLHFTVGSCYLERQVVSESEGQSNKSSSGTHHKR